MKASELRIGNYIEDDDSNLVEITTNNLHYIVNRHWLKGHYAIPITEEWLVKFGFEEGGNCPGWVLLKDSTKGDYIDENVLFVLSYWDEKVKYVHQLQNLYFALTGEELTLQTASSSHQ